MTPQEAAKKAAAEAACAYVADSTIVGLGTGSTADWAVKHLGERVRQGLRIRGVPTSRRTEALAREVGIPLVDLNDVESIDVTIDGADEVDPKLDLIKGLGGALLREKIVASLTKRQIIVVDPSKIVPKLGTKSPLPVEVIPFGIDVIARRIRALGHDPRPRMKEGKPFVTDNGNLVLDLHFRDGVPEPRGFEQELHAMPGVVETGLFLGMTWRVIVGEADGKIREIGR